MKSAVEGTVVHMRDFRSSEVGKQVGDALTSVTQALSSASETFFDEWEKLAVRAKKAAATTDDFVQESPWVAVGVAALIGIAAGFFVARAASGRGDEDDEIAADEQSLNDG